jgi:DNA ligase-associated metallophosphoesterase
VNIIEKNILFGGQALVLTNQRAVFWPVQSCLILADMHLGKAAHFRRHGIAIPGTVAERDLKRLEDLMLHYQPECVLLVGDLLHADSNGEVEAFAALTAAFANTEFVLIRGNHDRLPDSRLKQLGLTRVIDKLAIGNIQLMHQPVEYPTQHIICGHIHPGVRLRLPDKKKVSLPCYSIFGTQLVLPAFSLFTGLDTCSIPAGAVCYAFYEDAFFVVEV